MYPVLFEVFGITITSYGVSKALAALAAWFLLSREFRRRGWNSELAGTFVIASTIIGFLGGKLYYLAEQPQVALHHLGGAGFTWYGGFLAGAATFMFLARRHKFPLVSAAAASTVPVSLAYGIGRLGCLLAGDGTYGQPTDLPWGMTFPHAMVPTTVPVHPTPLYEALAAFAIAALLWGIRRHVEDRTMVGLYAVLSGTARFLVEAVRTNEPSLLGLTQPQLWSLLLIAAGGAFLLVHAVGQRAARHDSSRMERFDQGADEKLQA